MNSHSFSVKLTLVVILFLVVLPYQVQSANTQQTSNTNSNNQQTPTKTNYGQSAYSSQIKDQQQYSQSSYKVQNSVSDSEANKSPATSNNERRLVQPSEPTEVQKNINQQDENPCFLCGIYTGTIESAMNFLNKIKTLTRLNVDSSQSQFTEFPDVVQQKNNIWNYNSVDNVGTKNTFLGAENTKQVVGQQQSSVVSDVPRVATKPSTEIFTQLELEQLARVEKLGLDIKNPAVEATILIVGKGLTAYEVESQFLKIINVTQTDINHVISTNLSFGISGCSDTKCQAAEDIRQLTGLDSVAYTSLMLKTMREINELRNQTRQDTAVESLIVLDSQVSTEKLKKLRELTKSQQETQTPEYTYDQLDPQTPTKKTIEETLESNEDVTLPRTPGEKETKPTIPGEKQTKPTVPGEKETRPSNKNDSSATVPPEERREETPVVPPVSKTIPQSLVCTLESSIGGFFGSFFQRSEDRPSVTIPPEKRIEETLTDTVVPLESKTSSREKQTRPLVPGEKETKPTVPGEKETKPSVPGEKQTRPSIPGEKETRPSTPGEKETRPSPTETTSNGQSCKTEETFKDFFSWLPFKSEVPPVNPTEPRGDIEDAGVSNQSSDKNTNETQETEQVQRGGIMKMLLVAACGKGSLCEKLKGLIIDPKVTSEESPKKSIAENFKESALEEVEKNLPWKQFSEEMHTFALTLDKEMGHVVIANKDDEIYISKLKEGAEHAVDVFSILGETLDESSIEAERICLVHTHPLFNRIDRGEITKDEWEAYVASGRGIHMPPSVDDLDNRHAKELLEKRGFDGELIDYVYDGVGVWIISDLTKEDYHFFPEIEAKYKEFEADKNFLYGRGGTIMAGEMGTYLNSLNGSEIDKIFAALDPSLGLTADDLKSKKQNLWVYLSKLERMPLEYSGLTALDVISSDPKFKYGERLEKATRGMLGAQISIGSDAISFSDKYRTSTLEPDKFQAMYLSYAHFGKLAHFVPIEDLDTKPPCTSARDWK